MELTFWHERWQKKETGFHQPAVNELLQLYWPRLGVEAGAKVFVPLCGKSLDMVWLAVLCCMVLQTSFLTPPVGWALFFIKGVAPPGVTTRDIYIGIIPFVLLQLTALVIVIAYPDLALWLMHSVYD